jgi:hypothetical protein
MSPLPETPTLGKAYLILETPGWSNWMPRPVSGQGERRVGQIGGEILSAHVYRNKKIDGVD